MAIATDRPADRNSLSISGRLIATVLARRYSCWRTGHVHLFVVVYGTSTCVICSMYEYSHTNSPESMCVLMQFPSIRRPFKPSVARSFHLSEIGPCQFAIARLLLPLSLPSSWAAAAAKLAHSVGQMAKRWPFVGWLRPPTAGRSEARARSFARSFRSAAA